MMKKTCFSLTIAVAVSACAAQVPGDDVEAIEQPLQVADSRAPAPGKKVAYIQATQGRRDPARAAKLVAVEVDLADVAADSASAASAASVTHLYAGTAADIELE